MSTFEIGDLVSTEKFPNKCFIVVDVYRHAIVNKDIYVVRDKPGQFETMMTLTQFGRELQRWKPKSKEQLISEKIKYLEDKFNRQTRKGDNV